jgi:hypothetical protein
MDFWGREVLKSKLFDKVFITIVLKTVLLL